MMDNPHCDLPDWWWWILQPAWNTREHPTPGEVWFAQFQLTVGPSDSITFYRGRE